MPKVTIWTQRKTNEPSGRAIEFIWMIEIQYFWFGLIKSRYSFIYCQWNGYFYFICSTSVCHRQLTCHYVNTISMLYILDLFLCSFNAVTLWICLLTCTRYNLYTKLHAIYHFSQLLFRSSMTMFIMINVLSKTNRSFCWICLSILIKFHWSNISIWYMVWMLSEFIFMIDITENTGIVQCTVLT